jgi:hypothetical protein
VGSHHRVPTARARHELGWAPVVGYDEGLQEIAASLEGRAPRAARAGAREGAW